ncbi:MAG: DUF4375 domain-containing protein [Aliishimia sp.]
MDDAIFAESAETWAVSSGLADFVNSMLSTGQYRRDEIPAEAMWLYHADYYMAQVQNGGHSQFVHNSGMSKWISDDALNGLDLIGASLYASCLRDLRAWIKTHPQEAQSQDGFGTRADILDDIDARFYEAPSDAYYGSLREWLRGSDIVDLLPKQELMQAMVQLTDSNPERAKRERFSRIAHLQHGLSDPHLGLYRAAAATQQVDGKPFQIQALTAGFPVGHPTEKDGVIWGVQTTFGVLAGYANEDEVVLTQPTKENGFGVGAAIFSGDRAKAQACLDYAQTRPIAACAVALLAKVNKASQLNYIGPLTTQPSIEKNGDVGMGYVGETEDGTPYTFVFKEQAALIAPFPLGKKVMASLTRKDMQNLTHEIEAHNAYVPWR